MARTCSSSHVRRGGELRCLSGPSAGPHVLGSGRLSTGPFQLGRAVHRDLHPDRCLLQHSTPHLPKAAFSLAAVHSWVQYLTSIFFWPLSLWHPIFSVGQWPAGSRR